ncbi:MAG: metallophosphoesterase family protein [Deltaproteobacteria bacterium]|nr:metallophosphoesterase family protein [Deltaproteobacteria bacterium]
MPARDFAGEGFDAVDEDLLETNSTSCDATAFVHQPYILGVTKHSVRIVWRTDYAGDSTIEYGPTPSLGTEIEAGVFGRNHVTEIGGLEPETPYYYKVSTCGVESAVFPFRTAPERNTPFTFAVLGDNRSDPASYATVAAGIADAAPDIILNTGDIVADGWRKEQFEEQFFGPVGDLYSETPVFVSIGNHEGESPYHYSRFPYKNSRAGYYAFRYGNTLFISLNTNRLYLPGTPQYDWLVRVLSGASARTAEWIVVFAHHPAWSEGWDSPGYSGEWLLRYTVVPVLEQYGVDLYFCGHTHDYERGLRNGVTHIISGGADRRWIRFSRTFRTWWFRNSAITL